MQNLLRKHGGLELNHISIAKDNLDTSSLTETGITSLGTESDWGRRQSHASVMQAATHIRFPQDADKIKSCRTAVSRFGSFLDKLLDSGGLWAMDAQTLDYTPQEVTSIQYAHDFASTCTSLFSQIVNSAKCGTMHQAKLHLSGFKKDQLRLNIDTCQGTGWVSVLLTQ